MTPDEREQLKEETNAYLIRLMRAVYLHYNNRTDLGPIQSKHLELAKEARTRLHRLLEDKTDS